MTDDRDALCWACDGTDIAYVDAIGMRWCRKCYEDIYLGGV